MKMKIKWVFWRWPVPVSRSPDAATIKPVELPVLPVVRTRPAKAVTLVESPRLRPDGRTFTIGMSQCNLGEPWRVQMNKDIEEAAAKHPEIKLIERDAQNKSETQQASCASSFSSR